MDSSILSLAESSGAALLPVILGLTQLIRLLLPAEASGKFAPLISLALGILSALLFIGITRQAVACGVLLGLSASGLYSGIKSLAAKAGLGGYIRLRMFAWILVLCIVVIGSLGCAMGPAVPLTQEEQTRVAVSTYEDAFMAIYRSAREYCVANPQHKDKWNVVIQPLFSDAHKILAMKERAMLDQPATAAQIRLLVDEIAADAIRAMQAIGWIKPLAAAR